MPFVDILCSSDVVITKPGYGTFLEAACNGVPVVTLQRADWPETPFLMAWMEKHARIREIAREELWAGEVAGPIGTLLEQPPPLPVSPGGVQEAAAILESHLGR
jgi:UDP:flavonoid glycosyltransferase YjiC (YdhE family)